MCPAPQKWIYRSWSPTMGTNTLSFWRRKKNEQNKRQLNFPIKNKWNLFTWKYNRLLQFESTEKTCLETPGKRIQWTPWPECCAVVPSPTPAFPAADAEMSKMVGMQRTGNKTLRKPRKWLLVIFSMIFHICFFGKHGRMVANYFGVKLMDGTHWGWPVLQMDLKLLKVTEHPFGCVWTYDRIDMDRPSSITMQQQNNLSIASKVSVSIMIRPCWFNNLCISMSCVWWKVLVCFSFLNTFFGALSFFLVDCVSKKKTCPLLGPSNFEAWPVHMVPAKLGCGNLKMWTRAHHHDNGWEPPSIEEHSDGSQNIARGWFQIFLIFTPTCGNDRIWLIFFKGVETTHQIGCCWKCFFIKRRHHFHKKKLWI